MSESKQHWLDRNRPPRVQITYDVETGGALVKKELPLVVGILADLGAPAPVTPVAPMAPAAATATQAEKDAVAANQAAVAAAAEKQAAVEKARPAALKDRQFVEIDRDNFDEIMAKLTPSLQLKAVENHVAPGGSALNLDLAFSSLDDFGPVQVLQHLLESNDEVKNLFFARQQLSELLARMDGKDQLKQEIAKAIANPSTLPALKPDA